MITKDKARIKKLEIALQDLVDAVISSGAAEAVNSNDLGNALDAAKDILKKK